MELVGIKVTVYNEYNHETVNYEATIFDPSIAGLVVITDEGILRLPLPNLIKIHITDELRKDLNMDITDNK
jgi:hypothetical protein